MKTAILDGIRAPTTKAMLEEREGKVARLEASLALAAKREKVTLYLRPLSATCATSRAPSAGTRTARILEQLIGKVTLRREGGRVVREIGGNLPNPLNLETRWVDSFSAGRGIPHLPTWRLARRTVA